MFDWFKKKEVDVPKEEVKVDVENKEPEKESIDTTSYEYCLEKFKEEYKEEIELCEFKKSDKTGFCVGQTVKCMYEGSPKMTVSNVTKYNYYISHHQPFGYRYYKHLFYINEMYSKIETKYFNQEGNMITLEFSPTELTLESN